MLGDHAVLYARAEIVRQNCHRITRDLREAVAQFGRLRSHFAEPDHARFPWSERPQHDQDSNRFLKVEGSLTHGADDELARELSDVVGTFLERQTAEIYSTVIDAVDRVVIRTVLDHCDGNLLKAAATLGISRTRLRRKMKSLRMKVGIEIGQRGSRSQR